MTELHKKTLEAMAVILPKASLDERKQILDEVSAQYALCRVCNWEGFLDPNKKECPKCHNNNL